MKESSSFSVTPWPASHLCELGKMASSLSLRFLTLKVKVRMRNALGR